MGGIRGGPGGALLLGRLVETGMADGVYLNIRPEVHREAARKVAAYKAEYTPSSAAL
jgi:hypothetical protein